jgi:hypothetical protein
MMMESILGVTLGWEWTRLARAEAIRFRNSVRYFHERGLLD